MHIFFYYDAILSVRVGLSPFAPDGLIFEDFSHLEVINWSKFHLLYVVLSFILPQPNCLILKCKIIYIGHV